VVLSNIIERESVIYNVTERKEYLANGLKMYLRSILEMKCSLRRKNLARFSHNISH
jgi:hypothetical protein